MVINETIALNFFGTIDVIGNELIINDELYLITNKDCSEPSSKIENFRVVAFSPNRYFQKYPFACKHAPYIFEKSAWL